MSNAESETTCIPSTRQPRRTPFLIATVTASALVILATILIGLIDAAIIVQLFPEIEGASLVDGPTIITVRDIFEDNALLAAVISGSVAFIFSDRYYLSQAEKAVSWQRAVFDFLFGLAFGALFFFLFNACAAVCEMILSVDRIVIFILGIFIPSIVALFLICSYKRKSEGLTFNCFGIAISMASIYLSGFFFLLTLIPKP